jgi:hypothetical protein
MHRSFVVPFVPPRAQSVARNRGRGAPGTQVVAFAGRCRPESTYNLAGDLGLRSLAALPRH